MSKLIAFTLALALIASIVFSTALLILTPLGFYRLITDTPSCAVKKGIIL